MLSRTAIAIVLLAALAGAQTASPAKPDQKPAAGKQQPATGKKPAASPAAPRATPKPSPAPKPAATVAAKKPAPVPAPASHPAPPKPAATGALKKPAPAAAPSRPAPSKAVAIGARQKPASATASVAGKKSAPGKKPALKTAAKDAVAPELAPPAQAKSISLRGKRDPFMSIIQNRGLSTSSCTAGGKRCLLPEQIVLRGVVRGPNGTLAVVENAQRKTYFLRENDPVFNGQVVHITGDSIIFREKVTDAAGHEKTREIIKRVPGSKPV